MPSQTDRDHDLQVGAFQLRWYTLTDVGRVRKNNEDSLVASPEAGLFGVCDGLGGHAAGEVASAIASTTLVEQMRAADGSPRSLLNASLNLANERILEEQSAHPEMRGMGTTVSVIWLSEAHSQAWILHLGDSRIYLLRENQISQLTDDHSPVFRLFQRGDLTKEQIQQHPQKNLLDRSLGIASSISPDIFELQARKGDRLLACTDGLSDALLDQEIEALLIGRELADAGRELVDEANRRGGLDNITVALMELIEVPPATGRS